MYHSKKFVYPGQGKNGTNAEVDLWDMEYEGKGSCKYGQTHEFKTGDWSSPQAACPQAEGSSGALSRVGVLILPQTGCPPLRDFSKESAHFVG